MLSRQVGAGFMRGRRDPQISTGVYHPEIIDLIEPALTRRCFHEAFGRKLSVDFELPPGR